VITDLSPEVAVPRLRSINVGLPREVSWRGETVTTSIFKAPVSGRIRVDRLNLAGDRQSDLTVHGGVDKAVYVYPSEHYAYWREQLPGSPLPCGAFGENFTSDGLVEEAVCIGDRLRVGTAEFTVTQPRMPCFKLSIRFGRADMVKRFLRSGRPGFYLSVSKEGEVSVGDTVAFIARDERAVSVADVASLYIAGRADQDLLRRASNLPALPEGWRAYFRQRLWEPDV
jgi:MOSC domain-containing protein YiiM